MAKDAEIEIESIKVIEDSYETLLTPLMDIFNNQPLLQGSIFILLTFVLASALTWLIIKALRAITKRTRTYLDDRLVSIAKAPIYYSLMMFGFSRGITLMELSDKANDLWILGFQSFGAIIWMVFFIRVSKVVLKQLAWVGSKSHIIQPQTLPLFENLSKVLIVIMALYAGFQIWSIDMTAWLASAGVVGIAVGFAAKDTLANLFSGVFILADAPYKIGDYIVLDATGMRGKVTQIGLRSTRLITRDDVEVTIPNSIMGNSQVINQSGGPHPKFRIRVKVGVAYGTDIDFVRKLLLDIANAEFLVCETPAPRLRFRTFGASSLDFELLSWVDDPELRGRTIDSLNTTIYNRFNEENIEIPYSKHDVYIKELPKQSS